CQHHNSYPLTF
nr:immunoglobulin light chain junction region [Macaca mulatta]MOV34586.1 immunoglobulin light chain junction region [Macaca mulatta]MOX52158.1 immunoglobulin light chain junction region [Macaca mulatta]MOX53600.1 immunoglobulin light chain junction region [Macaca mulatta]MOX56052.1 immunoglobulin light chain junction region [Macaca mulatta]